MTICFTRRAIILLGFCKSALFTELQISIITGHATAVQHGNVPASAYYLHRNMALKQIRKHTSVPAAAPLKLTTIVEESTAHMHTACINR